MVMLKDFKIDHDILIVNPNLHVSTKWAFEKLNFKEELFAGTGFKKHQNF